MNGERLSATPGGIVLAPFSAIATGAARNFVVQMKAGRFHGFVVRCGDMVHGWVDRCPHAGLPLAHSLDQYLTADSNYVVCSWHGALFEPDTGLCVGGPCTGQRLTAWPVEVVEGQIITREGHADADDHNRR